VPKKGPDSRRTNRLPPTGLRSRIWPHSARHTRKSRCVSGWTGVSEPTLRTRNCLIQTVYTFNNRKAKEPNPGDFICKENPWIRRNLIEGDS
jgi:hypothetical protein